MDDKSPIITRVASYTIISFPRSAGKWTAVATGFMYIERRHGTYIDSRKEAEELHEKWRLELLLTGTIS